MMAVSESRGDTVAGAVDGAESLLDGASLGGSGASIRGSAMASDAADGSGSPDGGALTSGSSGVAIFLTPGRDAASSRPVPHAATPPATGPATPQPAAAVRRQWHSHSPAADDRPASFPTPRSPPRATPHATDRNAAPTTPTACRLPAPAVPPSSFAARS